MQFLIVGAGAIGSILGAHLARAGHAVAMLARGRRAAQVEEHGLVISGLADFTVPVRVVLDPASVDSADVLIVATKTPGTDRMLQTLRHLQVGLAFSIQNGPLKNDLLAATFGAERVLGSLADTSGELQNDGHVRFTRNVNTLVGELSGPISSRAQQLGQTIDAAGVRTRAVDNIVSLEWSKFVTWVGQFSLAVMTRAVTWQFLADPDSALLLVRMTREMGRLAAALGIPIVDNSNVPAAGLCQGSEQDAVATVQAAAAYYRMNSPDHRMSALQDVLAGRSLEVHETLGYAVKEAAELKLQLPVVEGFYRIIAAAERIRTAQGAPLP